MDDLTEAKEVAERMFGELIRQRETSVSTIVLFERGLRQSQLMPLTMGGKAPTANHTIDSQEHNPQ